MLKEPELRLCGVMNATLIKPNGDVHEFEEKNLILNEGFDFICNALASPSGRPNIMKYIAVGNDSTTAAPTQEGLLGQIGIKEATYAHADGTKSFTLTTTFEAGEASGSIKEAGVTNNSAGNESSTFLDRLTFGVINKELNDVLTVTFTFTFA